MEFARRDGTSYFYRCRCECGTETTCRLGPLQIGRIVSCGCIRGEARAVLRVKVRQGRVPTGARGSRLPPGESAFRKLYSNYRRAAADRHIGFELDRETFRNLTSAPCFYCDASPSAVFDLATGRGAYTYNGVDRVDNAKGYIPENCVPCCRLCNSLKGSATAEIINRAAAFLGERTRSTPP